MCLFFLFFLKGDDQAKYLPPLFGAGNQRQLLSVGKKKTALEKAIPGKKRTKEGQFLFGKVKVSFFVVCCFCVRS